MSDELARAMLESLRTMTDEDADRTWDAMVKDGIIDEDGNVLKRFPPEPPDWLTGRNGQSKAEVPAKPVKKSKRPRKRG